jgi:hypothetical protein
MQGFRSPGGLQRFVSAVFNTYVAASANRADADPAMPFFCWLAPNDLRLYVIDTYVGETYMVNNDDTIADSG